ASSMPKMRYGRHVQMSDPNTSLPLHSSWMRSARRNFGSDIFFGLPKMYPVSPPMGGRKSLMSSSRVMSSGYDPPVSSNRALRSTPPPVTSPPLTALMSN